MEIKYNFKGRLKVNAYKSMDCDVQMHVSVLEDDPWESLADKNKLNTIYPIDQYVDGIRVAGELSFFDQISSPMKISRGTGAGMSESVELELYYSDEPNITSRIKIVFLEKTATIRIQGNYNENKIYWQFCIIGTPLADGMNIFPDDFTGSNTLKVYSCNDFRGVWPYPVSSIIVASNVKEAKRILLHELNRAGIPIEDSGHFTFIKLDLSKSGCFILNDGKVL